MDRDQATCVRVNRRGASANESTPEAGFHRRTESTDPPNLHRVGNRLPNIVGPHRSIAACKIPCDPRSTSACRIPVRTEPQPVTPAPGIAPVNIVRRRLRIWARSVILGRPRSRTGWSIDRADLFRSRSLLRGIRIVRDRGQDLGRRGCGHLFEHTSGASNDYHDEWNIYEYLIKFGRELGRRSLTRGRPRPTTSADSPRSLLRTTTRPSWRDGRSDGWRDARRDA